MAGTLCGSTLWESTLCGAALRRQGLIDEAEHAIHRGLILAQECGDKAAEARQLQRLAFVHGDRGDLEIALAKTSLALTSFQSLHLMEDVGRCWVDLGGWYSKLLVPERAASALKIAVEMISQDDFRNQFAIRLGLAHCLYKQGLNKESLEWITSSDQVLPRDNALKATRFRLEAGVRSEMGETKAIGLYSKAIDLYLGLPDPLNAAAATIEWVSALRRLGQHSRARKVAKDMARFIQPLRSHRLAVGALLELTRHALSPNPLPIEVVIQAARALGSTTVVDVSQGLELAFSR